MIHSFTSRSSNSLPRSVPSGRAVGEAEAPGWLTFRQTPLLGDNVRKGQRGAIVVYADRFVPEDEKQPAAETSEDPQSGARFICGRPPSRKVLNEMYRLDCLRSYVRPVDAGL